MEFGSADAADRGGGRSDDILMIGGIQYSYHLPRRRQKIVLQMIQQQQKNSHRLMMTVKKRRIGADFGRLPKQK
jgi:hypothetical protein